MVNIILIATEYAVVSLKLALTSNRAKRFAILSSYDAKLAKWSKKV